MQRMFAKTDAKTILSDRADAHYNDLDPKPTWTCRFSRLTSDGFYVEFASAVCSIAVTIVLAALLFVYDDQALPSWPWGITLNAMVSLLVTAAKGMVLLAAAEGISQYKWLHLRSESSRPLHDIQTFDSASRGPWGAIKMLVNWKTKPVVAMACLITVLCLALDPFGQQVLVYRTRKVQIDTASVASTTSYNEPSNDTFASVESPMLQAIYTGVLDDKDIQPLSPFCATGNCTFDTFDTLGFCSECCDVGPSVEQECRDTDYSTRSCRYRFPGGVDIYFNNSKPFKLMDIFSMPINTTLPSGDSMCDIQAIGNSVASFGLIEVWPDTMTSLKSASFCALFPCIQKHTTQVLSGTSSASVLATWRNSSDDEYIGNPSNGTGQIVIWQSTAEGSHMASQSLRRRANISTTLPSIIQPPGGLPDQPPNTTLIQIGFNDRLNYPYVVSNAAVVTQVFQNISSLLAAPLGLKQSDVVVAYLQPKNTIAELGYASTVVQAYYPTHAIPRLRLLLLAQASNTTSTLAADPATQSLLYTLDYSVSQVPAIVNSNSGSEDLGDSSTTTRFLMSQKRFFALNAWFSKAFTGTVSQSYDLLRGNVYQLDQITASSDLISVIYNHGNITRTMQNLATSMTNYIRNNGSSEGVVEGAALGIETYVHVRWAWLSLLVACVLGTLMFLVCVVVSTKKHGDGLAWKSSVLAILFHGLETEEQNSSSTSARTEQVRLVSGMGDLAQTIRVRLVESDDGTMKLRQRMIEKSRDNLRDTR